MKPSVTTTSATPPVDVAALDVADELEGAVAAAPTRCAQLGVRLEHQRAAAPGLLAVGQQPDARALDAEHGARDSAAPMNANCTRCSRRTSALAPTSSSVTGLPGDRQRQRQRRAVDAARAPDVEQARGERRAGRRRRRRAPARGRRRPRAPPARSRPRVARARRAPGRRSWRSTPARRRSRRRRRRLAELAGRARTGSRARPARRRSRAPAATSAGPRSAPLASTATTDAGARVDAGATAAGRLAATRRGRDRGRAARGATTSRPA